jgi:cytochrome c oxidase assembly protein subunit 15
MMSLSATDGRMNRWSRRLALLLIVLTFPLIWVGGLVTTTDAGMAVPDWPNTYGYNMLLYPWESWLLGPWDLFIEHGHRLLGALVGMVTIALMVVVLKTDARSWMRKLVIVALVAVIAQGILGGVRVRLNDVTLAMIHGCTGPAFLVLTTIIAVMFSAFWQNPVSPELSAAEADNKNEQNEDSEVIEDDKQHFNASLRLARLTTILVYCQLILGASIRHIPVTTTPQTYSVLVIFHIGMALAVTGHIVMLCLAIRCTKNLPKSIRSGAKQMGILIFVQLLMGIGTWVLKFGWPAGLGNNKYLADHLVVTQGWFQSHVVTGHVAMGSVILVMAAVLTTRLLRLQFVRQKLEATVVIEKS